MKLVIAIGALLVGSVTARATTLVEYGDGELPTPALSTTEAACDADVRIVAGLATVETRQRLVNARSAPRALAYEFDLPAAARIVAASVRGSLTGEAVGVPAGFATEVAPDPDVVGADPVVVSRVEDQGGRVRYRAVLQMLPAGGEVVLTLRWSMAVAIEGGALRVDLPGRDSGNELAPCRATFHATAGAGATVARLHAGATTAAANGMTFALGDAGVAVAADLAFARPRPVAWTQREDLGDGWTAALVTVAAPVATPAPGKRHVLFVIDASRSMEMIGTAAVGQVVDAVAAAVPDGDFDAVVYDRAAARVVGSFAPAQTALPAIRDALAHRARGNGSDLAGALAIARGAVAAGGALPTSVVIVGDGAGGELAGAALDGVTFDRGAAVDLHAIALVPSSHGGGLAVPDAARWTRLAERFGGSYVAVPVGAVDRAAPLADGWLAPAWFGIAVAGLPAGALPAALPAGAGASATLVVHGAVPAFALAAHAGAAITAPAADAGSAAVGALALAAAGDTVPAPVRARLRIHHPAVDASTALAVLAASGKVARGRRDVVVAGGPYTRVAAIADPAWETAPPPAVVAAGPSAVDHSTVERLLREGLQPAAYACYTRALGASQGLGGTVRVDLDIARGEVTGAAVAGLGNAGFDACLLDAAYALRPPVPDLDINSDDETIVHYPMTFAIRQDKPFVVAGDADSDQPIDIDAVRGGVPVPAKAIRVDASTPLGGMKP